jgi:hypothetical protein
LNLEPFGERDANAGFSEPNGLSERGRFSEPDGLGERGNLDRFGDFATRSGLGA